MARITYNTAYWLDNGSGFSNYGSLEAWVPSLGGDTWAIDSFMNRSNGDGSWQSRYLDSSGDLGYFIGPGSEPLTLIWEFEQFPTVTGWGEWVVDDFNLEVGATIPDDSVAYDSWPGTSMATPHVAGIAALMLAEKPGLSAGQLKDIIMDTVDVPGTLGGLCVTEGRVNAAAAVEKAGETAPVPGGGGAPALTPGVTRVAGANRYATAVEASKRAYPNGADAVVIATGANWPDALGGSALAGAIQGPLLLTTPDALSPEVETELGRLGANYAYVLGGTGAVSAGVEAKLKQLLGVNNVVRLAGANRYETATVVAEEVIASWGADYDGTAFVATGANYPDALAGSPVAAALGWPILLAPPGGTLTVPAGVTSAVILGGTGAVSAGFESMLANEFGSSNVVRQGGADRYQTAALVAQYGVAAGLSWNGIGIATGAAFPDALSGGAMLGRFGTVMLLTPSTSLHPAAASVLSDNASEIEAMHIIGGTGAVSTTVEAQAKAAAGL